MIDICDFAVGLSRQLHGLTIASERPGHRLMEQWHPLGPIGVITAFNFPVAVWSWNAALALVCGNTVIWKPSELTPLTALASDALFQRAAAEVGAPAHLNQVVLGDGTVGAELVASTGVPLVSATGSTAMGAKVGPVVAGRFGRSILELGGNNAAIVTAVGRSRRSPSAASCSPRPAPPASAAPRCAACIVHRSRLDEVVSKVSTAFASLPVGNPLDHGTLVGPLITPAAHDRMLRGARPGDRRRRQRGGRRRADVRRRGARRRLRAPGPRVDARPDRHRGDGDLRADALRDALRRLRRGDRDAERRAAGPGEQHLHHRRPRGRAVHGRRRQRLRHRQREHRPERRRDRRGVRRREDDRRRPRERQRRVEGLHAASDEHDQLLATSCRWPRASSSADRGRRSRWRRRRRRQSTRRSTRRLPVALSRRKRPLSSAGRKICSYGGRPPSAGSGNTSWMASVPPIATCGVQPS